MYVCVGPGELIRELFENKISIPPYAKPRISEKLHIRGVDTRDFVPQRYRG